MRTFTIQEVSRRTGLSEPTLRYYEAGVRAAVRHGGAEVHHVASAIPAGQPDDPDELIVLAREGTLRVLRAARTAGTAAPNWSP
ncbi:hypothetical protein [Actinomadura sp. NPDC048394]|uniref:hypothetical protein n=1 Tax=Actinomadura sp. NPDC048394 TaxID=3158223 RepID=UPI0034090AC7